MSAELPQDLRSHFATLEQQAYSLLRTGNYDLAEKIYRAMLETVLNRQESENRRIHKGSFYHQIGFSLALKDRLLEALENFLLAYVEDTLNVPFIQENDADGSPAAKVLRNGFHLNFSVFDAIKEISRRRKERNEIVKNPDLILSEYLNQIDIGKTRMLSLCNPLPTGDDIRRQLIVTLTPQAQKVLNEEMSRLGEQLLQKAAVIARSKGHKDITEEDVQEAITEIGG